MTDATHTLTSPALLYLFAEHNAPAASGIFKEFALAPRSGEKVDLKHLVLKTYLAAWMDLSEAGILTLDVIELKKFLGKETAVVPNIASKGAAAPNSLASKLLLLIGAASKPEQRRVRELVISVIGGRSSTNYPWLMALVPVIFEASAAGLVTMPEKKPGLLKALFKPYESVTTAKAVPQLVDVLESDMRAAVARLDAFEVRLGATAQLLRKEIENGIKACMDNDSD